MTNPARPDPDLIRGLNRLAWINQRGEVHPRFQRVKNANLAYTIGWINQRQALVNPNWELTNTPHDLLNLQGPLPTTRASYRWMSSSIARTSALQVLIASRSCTFALKSQYSDQRNQKRLQKPKHLCNHKSGNKIHAYSVRHRDRGAYWIWIFQKALNKLREFSAERNLIQADQSKIRRPTLASNIR